MKQLYRNLFSESRRLQFHFAWYRLRSLFYRGSARYCPCCDTHYRCFLPKGNQTRPDAECPGCGSLERTRLLHCYLQRETPLFSKAQGLSLLHVAPEYGLKKQLAKLPDLSYIDIDLNPAFASMQADLTKLPFPDQHFDFILCSHVLGHIPDQMQALREMARVLKPQGRLLLLSLLDLQAEQTLDNPNWTSPNERLRHYGENDLCRLYALKDFAQIVESQGFVVKGLDYRLSCSQAERQLMSLGDGQREWIFECQLAPK